MAGINTAALHDIVVERDMPRGYTWAKVIKCWTSDPQSARFFPPRTTDFGDDLPAAYFTAVLCYDQEAGWIERQIKFMGTEAESAVLALKEDNQIALISCQGHVSTQAIQTPDGKTVARSVIMVKTGSTIIHEMEEQGLRPEDKTLEEAANLKMREIEPKAAPAVDPNAHIQDATFDETVWPDLVDYDSKKDMDDAPF